MSALRNVTQGFRNLWGAADDYDETPETAEVSAPDSYAPEAPARDERAAEERSSERPTERETVRTVRPERSERVHISTSPTPNTPNYGGGDAGGRRLRSVAMPSRASREKNIYTLKPKSLEESCVAADYLKTGCAVVLNLEAVEQNLAIRIIDFMSGVCYGLEHQGHAMKLGEKIFLFTPGDFEIASDEIDYAENRDLIFKDVVMQPALEAPVAVAGTVAETAPTEGGERRSWER